MISLKDLLHRSKTLKPMIEQIELKKQVQNQLISILPESFKQLFTVISVKNQIVHIEVINGMMASYFTQRQKILLSQLASEIEISAFKIQVNAHLQEQFLSAVDYNPMNDHALNTLEHLANQAKHESIQAGLQKILETQKRLKNNAHQK